jgi:anti-sigma B factor antagonist
VRVDGRDIRPPLPYAIAERPSPPGVVVLALSGELDLAVVPLARERLEQARAQRPRAIVLVMSEVTFADSSALRELLRLDAAMGADGSLLVLAALSPAVERLLELTRARDLLTVAETVGEALDRVTSQRRLKRPGERF